MVQNGLFSFIVHNRRGEPLPEYPDLEAGPLDRRGPISCTSYIQTPPEDEDQSFSIRISAIQASGVTTVDPEKQEFFAIFDGVDDPLGWSLNQDLTLKIDNFSQKNTETGRFDGKRLKFNKDELGTIVIEVIEVLATHPYDDDPHKYDIGAWSLTKLNVVHEKDLKASFASHSISLGETVDKGIRPTQTAEYGRVLQRIKFKYRSKAALQAIGHGVVPVNSLPVKQKAKAKARPEIIVIEDGENQALRETRCQKQAMQPQKRKREIVTIDLEGNSGGRKKIQTVDLSNDD
ncbi:hypothetical protein BJ508DRAFT_326734 [Ascobolus immersus RN42]|uniref:DUF7918 domain-containing protein n=1 Tax=Ascobolus immersus RN42 TaxID=1160509 RepID=A0A3N4I4V8_ASCIM|nr:hypothetical protein BJ508DRAFT_326734 [Ascobolus immersus RN42]